MGSRAKSLILQIVFGQKSRVSRLREASRVRYVSDSQGSVGNSPEQPPVSGVFFGLECVREDKLRYYVMNILILILATTLLPTNTATCKLICAQVPPGESPYTCRVTIWTNHICVSFVYRFLPTLFAVMITSDVINLVIMSPRTPHDPSPF